MPKTDVEVRLVGTDSNAFSTLGIVKKAMLKQGCSKEQADEFFEEATSGDYDNLMSTVFRWVNVVG